MMFKVVCLDFVLTDISIEIEHLSPIGANVIQSNATEPNEIIDLCHDADALIVNQAKITRNIISKLSKCKVIARYGVGVDNIDLSATKEYDILVTNTPGYCTEEVSDVALMMTLLLMRHGIKAHQKVINKHWGIHQIEDIYSIQGKTIGILGFGAIGRSFQRKIKVFNPKKILVKSDFLSPEEASVLGVHISDLEDILKNSDIISIHMPLTKKNKHLICKTSLKKMKTQAILINTGRGPIINEYDLAHSLKNKEIRGAGLDVFESEPLDENSPLRTLDNIIFSPHLAWYSKESIKKMKTMVSNDVLTILTGKKSINIIE